MHRQSDGDVRSVYISTTTGNRDKSLHEAVCSVVNACCIQQAVNTIIIGNQRNGSTPTFHEQTRIDIRYIILNNGDYRQIAMNNAEYRMHTGIPCAPSATALSRLSSPPTTRAPKITFGPAPSRSVTPPLVIFQQISHPHAKSRTLKSILTHKVRRLTFYKMSIRRFKRL